MKTKEYTFKAEKHRVAGMLLYARTNEEIQPDQTYQMHGNQWKRQKKNGVTGEEMAEILIHATFYAGWSKAWAAFRMAKEVYAE